MEYFYIIVAVLAMIVECTSTIDTKNLVKKIGLALIVLGCIIHLGHYQNNLFEIGSMLYISADLWRKWFFKKVKVKEA